MNFRLFLPLVLAVTATTSQAQLQALAINFSGDVYNVNSGNGTGVFVGSSGLNGTNCMARANDKWWTIDNAAKFYRIIPNTGAAILVGTLNLAGNLDVRGLAIDTNLKSYVVVNKATSDELWTFDPVTFVGTFVGSMGSTTIQGLAIGFNGRLYAYDTSTTNSGGLREVNPLTGATSDLDPTAPGQPGIQDIAPRGNELIGGRDSLYDVFTAAGTEVLRGTGGYSDLRGFGCRQNPLQFDAMTVKLGRLQSGTVESMFHRGDGNVATVTKFVVPNQTVDPINVEAVFGTDVSLNELREIGVYWVGRGTVNGSFQVAIDVLNQSTSLFENWSTTVLSTAGSELVGARTVNLANYFNANKRITVRFRVKPTGFVASSSWGVETDMLRVEQIGAF